MKSYKQFISTSRIIESVTANQQKYLDIIINYLKEHSDEDIFEYDEEFMVHKTNSTNLTGKLYLTENGKAIRFNFADQYLHSIDVWENFELENNEDICNQPSLTMMINTTVVDGILDDIVDFFENEEPEIYEAKSEEPFEIRKPVTEDVELKSITINKAIINEDLDIFEVIKYNTMQVASVFFKQTLNGQKVTPTAGDNGLIISGDSGVGKCLGKGTKIIMFDGTLKNVEEIKVGDKIMGPDSLCRNILNINSGTSELYEVKQNKGINYIVNDSHILSLKKSSYSKNHHRYEDYTDYVNISIEEYLKKNKTWKSRFYGYKVDIDFPKKEVPIEPYFLGLWLGDGLSNRPSICTVDEEIKNYLYEHADRINYKISAYYGKDKFDNNDLNLMNNKHIPDIFLYNDKKTRLELLAGIIDTDGYTTSNGYEITQKSEILTKQIKFLADSLGFKTTLRKRLGKIKKLNFEAEYFRLSINGDVDIIPIKIERKKVYPKRKVDHRITGIKVNPIGIGEYYGFEIDGDRLFLLEDCTVTHNTHTVTESLDELGVEYTEISGDITVAGLFQHLFENRNTLTIFDDCNSVFKDKECAIILMAALDTYPVRKISRMLKTHFNSDKMSDEEIQKTYEDTGKLPKQFDFKGRAIFITNVEGDKIDPAVVSRCLHVDVKLNRQEMLDRMSKIMENLFPQLSMKVKLETLEFLDYMVNNFECKFPLNIRSLIHSLNIRRSNDFTKNISGEHLPVWQMLIKAYLVKKENKA